MNRSTEFPIPESLSSDCNNCFGLCCVALPYAKSADFPFHKDSGEPCRHLLGNYRCRIHDQLREEGFRGCSVYECFGAGQKVSQQTYSQNDWRTNGDTANEMFEVFPIMQQLHEMLRYLHEAFGLEIAKPFHHDIKLAIHEINQLTNLSPTNILALDISKHRANVNDVLLQTSERFRAKVKRKNTHPNIKKGHDLIGAKLRGANLSGFNFRGALLIAADLRKADLRMADMIGADLRDANICGADLRDCLFLTQAQVQSANGDKNTKLPQTVTTPEHWL
ncbi:pentapeptide repeat-containing protein [Halalkalibacter sp. APA_J-10(15)]|uniref:pentapeptide repeat-containing protein n=1 Tax=Halalkalibacter sp. APA_J-10(15) TaxID=2933805 RepID=UPI001FF2FA80|nr:pentapeptide repeat-containing protein [Halalkalibacter sp. APA_J-10(15)]MCK0471063.1 pentapeptide repeat-containing protein [Halalkalibacter sp. APA_J-10(15)]